LAFVALFSHAATRLPVGFEVFDTTLNWLGAAGGCCVFDNGG
jgi:hypothetical protein